jgi:hypothetical protein
MIRRWIRRRRRRRFEREAAAELWATAEDAMIEAYRHG